LIPAGEWVIFFIRVFERGDLSDGRKEVVSSRTIQTREEAEDIFCWPEEKLVPVQICFECPKQDRCRSYQTHVQRYEDAVARLRKAWDTLEPKVEIIIRKKRRTAMPEEKKGSAPRTKQKQLYYYVLTPGEGDEETQEIGDEDRILEIVKTGGKIVKIYKLGDEQEVVIKIQKKVPPSR